jgi:hypothetical protein
MTKAISGFRFYLSQAQGRSSARFTQLYAIPDAKGAGKVKASYRDHGAAALDLTAQISAFVKLKLTICARSASIKRVARRGLITAAICIFIVLSTRNNRRGARAPARELSVGWAKLPGTAIAIARRHAILPTRLRREFRARVGNALRVRFDVVKMARCPPCRIFR